MTYNDMPVIIPLLATGYLLTIYLLLILAQRTIKSSQYIADSLTDAYASYVPTEQAPHTDDVEQRSRSLQRAPKGRWTKTEPNSSTTSFGATAVTPTRRYLSATNPPTFRRTPTPKEDGYAEQETLQGIPNANIQENEGSSPLKSLTPEL